MEENEDYWKETGDEAIANRGKKEVKTFASHAGAEAKGEEESEEGNHPSRQHSSQGHTTDAKGTATNTREPTLRSATRDSTRMPKSDNDEGPTGGNIR
ncbi:hypothetical protein [Pontibacter sp. SGAir0037]|uniref:hypothetical protein n=1 Tax=Pontibacter sp. SGAir0037 TaxID=2571030 RepID=UPI0010CD1C99|nr:hypothetical protein [Pontibacter sp. SGAir0037]QCR23809.1 hypothetical protein C1N53_16605 [Pontibacter sp. SGAir0037]